MTAADPNMPTAAAKALTAPLSRLVERWLDVQCRCGQSSATPLRLTAIRHGGGVRPLADLASRFACRSCGQRSVEIGLCQTLNRLFRQSAEPGWSVLLHKLTSCEVVNL